jgi:hypothetical protein
MLRSNIAGTTASLIFDDPALPGHPAKPDRGSAKPASTGIGEVSKSVKLQASQGLLVSHVDDAEPQASPSSADGFLAVNRLHASAFQIVVAPVEHFPRVRQFVTGASGVPRHLLKLRLRIGGEMELPCGFGSFLVRVRQRVHENPVRNGFLSSPLSSRARRF